MFFHIFYAMIGELILLLFKLSFGSDAINPSCGLDQSSVTAVDEGTVPVENYPWLGMLYYPIGRTRITTNVVLVTRQIVIAAASEVDKLPKTDFRENVRVVLGGKCGAREEIKVRDYAYHPEYLRDTISTLAMVQLETDHVDSDMSPICQPPGHFINPQFFALTLANNCKHPKMQIYRMKYVNIEECRNFYRSTGLGFSVYGPGCGDPARFIDYGMYHQWVERSSATVGQPAITRIRDNRIILRRSLANIQRYGPCDPEEKISELYSDRVAILSEKDGVYHAKYNVSLYANVEYSCITFMARHFHPNDYEKDRSPPLDEETGAKDRTPPKIRLRRWSATSSEICFGFQHIELEFYVDITFYHALEFTMHAYGREPEIISAASTLKNINKKRGILPNPPEYLALLKELKKHYRNTSYKWFPTK